MTDQTTRDREPVAWGVFDTDGEFRESRKNRDPATERAERYSRIYGKPYAAMPLYTAPRMSEAEAERLVRAFEFECYLKHPEAEADSDYNTSRAALKRALIGSPETSNG